MHGLHRQRVGAVGERRGIPSLHVRPGAAEQRVREVVLTLLVTPRTTEIKQHRVHWPAGHGANIHAALQGRALLHPRDGQRVGRRHVVDHKPQGRFRDHNPTRKGTYSQGIGAVWVGPGVEDLALRRRGERVGCPALGVRVGLRPREGKCHMLHWGGGMGFNPDPPLHGRSLLHTTHEERGTHRHGSRSMRRRRQRGSCRHEQHDPPDAYQNQP